MSPSREINAALPQIKALCAEQLWDKAEEKFKELAGIFEQNNYCPERFISHVKQNTEAFNLLILIIKNNGTQK